MALRARRGTSVLICFKHYLAKTHLSPLWLSQTVVRVYSVLL